MTCTRINPVDKVTTQSGWTVTTRTDGLVEVKMDFTKTFAGSDWAAWGSLYYADMAQATAYPFTFSQRPSLRIELYRLQGGEVIGFSTSATTGIEYTHFPRFMALRPSTYSGSITVSATVYATGIPA